MKSLFLSAALAVIVLLSACKKEEPAYPDKFYFSPLSIALIPNPNVPELQVSWNEQPVIALVNDGTSDFKSARVPRGNSQRLQISEKNNGKVWIDTTLDMPAAGLSYMYLFDSTLHLSVLTNPPSDTTPDPIDDNYEVINFLNAYGGSGMLNITFFRTSDFAVFEPVDSIKDLPFGSFTPYKKLVTQVFDNDGNLMQYYYTCRVNDATTGEEYLSEYEFLSSDRGLFIAPDGAVGPKLKYMIFNRPDGLAVTRLPL